MSRPIVEDQPRQYRNGFYSHESLRKPHRVHVVDVGGLSVVFALIGVLFLLGSGAFLGGVWLFRTAWSLLVGHG